MQNEDELDPPAAESLRKSAPIGLALLLFCLGVAIGVLAAVTGHGILENSARLIIAVFLTAIILFILVAGVLFLSRKRLLNSLFGVADTQLQLFADPLSKVAESAAQRDAARATEAAKSLLQVGMARYAMVTTRRWIIASITGLIASMAALAGTALLFKQNELIEVQTSLLNEQNARIAEQTGLLQQQVELAEAARNAEIAVEITNIAGLLGQAMDEVQAKGGAPARTGADKVPILDPLQDLSQSLIMRIIAASRAAKPYRSLSVPYAAHDQIDKLRAATQRRRDDLPLFYAQSKRIFGFEEPPDVAELIARPTSPERAQLLRVLARSGVVDFELLNFFGLDLSFAAAEDIQIFGRSMQASQLSFADFSRAVIHSTDLRASFLENARFLKAQITATDMSFLPQDAAKPDVAVQEGGSSTALSGAIFERAQLNQVQFLGSQLTAASFDRAALFQVNFAHAGLQAATFVNAFIAEADFTGAALQSADFDGAWVLRADFLEHLTEVSAPQSFVAQRYEISQAGADDLQKFSDLFPHLDQPTVSLYQIRRIAPFEGPTLQTKSAGGEEH